MTEPSSSQPTDISKPSNERLYMLAALGLLALAALYFFYKSRTVASTTSATNLKLVEENANMKEKLRELEDTRISHLEHQQVAKSKLHEIQAEYQSVSAMLDTLQSRIDNWQKSADDALDSELGKRIASDAQLLKEYEGIIAEKRPSPDTARRLRAQLGELKAPLESAEQLEQGTYAPTERFVMTIATLAKDAEDAADLYLKHQGALESILARAPSTPAEMTLRSALIQRKRQQDEEQARLIADELEKARQEIAERDAKAQADNERKIAAAKREQEQLIAEAEAKRLAEEAALKIAEIAAQTGKASDGRKALEDAAKADLARVQLERDFEKDLTEIKSLLRPMLALAKTQPGNNRQLERVAGTGPISLSKLRGVGALDPSERGVQLLHYLFGAPGHDRDMGGFPRFGSVAGKKEEDNAWRAQELLIKYGDLMVEKKMLAE